MCQCPAQQPAKLGERAWWRSCSAFLGPLTLCCWRLCPRGLPFTMQVCPLLFAFQLCCWRLCPRELPFTMQVCPLLLALPAAFGLPWFPLSVLVCASSRCITAVYQAGITLVARVCSKMASNRGSGGLHADLSVCLTFCSSLSVCL